jgi:hypothetical protein
LFAQRVPRSMCCLFEGTGDAHADADKQAMSMNAGIHERLTDNFNILLKLLKRPSTTEKKLTGMDRMKRIYSFTHLFIESMNK